ncbi:sulfate permease [Xylariaceae sp. FL0662B]|nr:sulfate permease [Xylariaceae sp. FL0662B]
MGFFNLDKLRGRFFNFDQLRERYETDETISRVRRGLSALPAELPSAAGQYIIDKVPIIQWIPRYMYTWVVYDFIAGITNGFLMVPQGLAYAKIAKIPIVYGLYSSWLPSAIYIVMGTSKDLSTGPTSILALLTADAVEEISKEGYTPQAIASALAMMVGVYSLMLGLFKLGFILDYVSAPVLSGFVSASAITIMLGQVSSLVGLENVGSGAVNVIHDVLTQLSQMKPLTVIIGLSGIACLYAIELVGKHWGKKHPAIKFATNSRAVLTLMIFTIISFGVNKDRDTPVWATTNVNVNSILPPEAPRFNLLQKVATKAIAPVVTAALEHLAIGKAFSRKNNYAIDQSQELCYIGVANFFNSFFGGMSVSGAMSRTAVNSECGSRSPLNGLFTAGFILLTIYKLAGVLFWIPQATLSAIIIMAVIHVVAPISLFFEIWRISFADFIASMLSFWVTLFVGTETGIAVAVGFSIAYTLIRQAFAKPSLASATTSKGEWASFSDGPGYDGVVPNGMVVVNLTDAMFFPNAERVKTDALESIQARHYPTTTSDPDERSWSVAAEKRLERTRQMGNITPSSTPLRVVVMNFTRVPFMDTSGVNTIRDFRKEVEKYIGHPIELRLAGLTSGVRRRFERAEWDLVDGDTDFDDATKGGVVYGSLEKAIWDPRDDLKAEDSDDEKV